MTTPSPTRRCTPDIPRRRRERLHRAAGEALERHAERVRRRRASEIARHFVEGRAPAGAALPMPCWPGTKRRRCSRTGKRSGTTGVRSGWRKGWATNPRRREALERLGGVLATTVRYDEALSVLERAAKIHLSRDDPEATGRVEAAIAQTHFRRGTPEEGTARLSAHLKSLDRPGASKGVRRGLASLYVALARLYWAHRWYAGCRDAAERAVSHARYVEDAGLLSEAEAMRGTVLLWSGVPDEAVAALETSLALAEGPDAPDALVTVPQLSLWLAYLARGQFDRSRGCAERGAAVAKKTGDTDLLAVHTANLGLQHFYEGDWREARDCLERAVDLARGTQLSYYSYLPSAYLGVLRKAEGAWEEAIRCFSDAAALAGKAGNREGSRYAEVRLLELDVLRGRPAEAIARLGPEVPELTWWYEVLLLTVLAEAYADSGDAVKAEEVAAGAVGRARATRNRVDGVEALRVRAKGLSMRGRPEEASAALEEALSWACPMPYPYAEARILYEYGMLHVREGEPGGTRERLSAALDIFRRLGAKKEAGRTERALLALDPA